MASPQTQPASTPEPAGNGVGKSHTVKVRVKHGRLLVHRKPAKVDASGVVIEAEEEDRYAEVGDVVEVDRRWAEKLLSRKFDGYPSTNTNGAPGLTTGVVSDCPIELVH